MGSVMRLTWSRGCRPSRRLLLATQYSVRRRSGYQQAIKESEFTCILYTRMVSGVMICIQQDNYSPIRAGHIKLTYAHLSTRITHISLISTRPYGE
ncbi:hypothetical protein J6590_029709 [Homalodisca vitripennis]|nr:hypothetical protein J6590_029706 [Homalodisca vitripennis]KAG8326953.1 hypothetical protein J6590_029709 [Homalodisca vitripennis]